MQSKGAQPDVEKVRKLIALMERRGLTRLVLTEGDDTIRLEVTAPAVSAGAEAPAAVVMPVAPVHVAPVEEVEEQPAGVPLLSPTTGTFYRAPAPGEAPFVEVGDMVETGQTVGIIMAMKVMSEIPSEIDGVVVAIPAQDGELVQPGAPLVIIQPNE